MSDESDSPKDAIEEFEAFIRKFDSLDTNERQHLTEHFMTRIMLEQLKEKGLVESGYEMTQQQLLVTAMLYGFFTGKGIVARRTQDVIEQQIAFINEGE